MILYLFQYHLKKIGGRDDSFDIIINGEKGRKLPIFDISNFIVTKDSNKGIGSKIQTAATWTSASNDDESCFKSNRI
jgi:hypothetical protein